jgi:glycosyltransferase involved in cell wall biosynthesis
MNPKVKVSFLHRKPRAVGNYSLEFIFKDVRNRLSEQIEASIFYSKYESAGLFKRIYNVIEARFRQNKVTHVTGDVNYLGCLLRKKTTIHTVLDCVFLNSTTGIKHKVLKLFWLTIPVQRSTFITAISQATKDEILKYVPCNPDKIVVIPVAISENFQVAPKVFNKAKPTILQLGTAPNKNIERLIEALKGISCTLEIVGAAHPHLKELLIQNNIDYVYTQGLTDAEILHKYQQADIVTLVSTYEGFGMPILEAQAVGRVVITANVFSMPEVGGTAAHYVNPTSVAEIKAGFEKLINEDVYRNDLIQKGFENVKRYNPDGIAKEYFELYKKIEQQ